MNEDIYEDLLNAETSQTAYESVLREDGSLPDYLIYLPRMTQYRVVGFTKVKTDNDEWVDGLSYFETMGSRFFTDRKDEQTVLYTRPLHLFTVGNWSFVYNSSVGAKPSFDSHD
ncbi:hypothetical protein SARAHDANIELLE_26 [Hafnia phage vB_HpaM_SarahDanielle]|uniref:Uncharacterized protein n=1 Tax=Hafnia phage vB_HpaM_SarahDanielle TaxID=2836113 RepID=A0AAE8BFC4_9CAUD|nr:hypothetical protein SARAHDANIELLE_26 [Hafnia phage vB_HpaM_SarahDanielle]